MNRKCISLLLAVFLLLSALTGCEVVSEIAGNVADAAMQELEAQVKETLETYKVEVVEIKTAVGKLNGTSGNIQFFCAALATSESPDLPQACADALGKVFDDAGVSTTSGNVIKNSYLEHKELSFKFTDFDSEKTYYIIYVYMDDLAGLVTQEK